MRDKICLITGATAGIGLATARALAAKGATVLIHGRNPEKGAATAAALIRATGNEKVSFVRADFTSLADTRALGRALAETLPRLDVLINNAGVMTETRTLTKDGYEANFAVNHLAHFLLTNLLLDKLRSSAPSQIIIVASHGHRWGALDFDDLMMEKNFKPMRAYSNSKLANLLFMRALVRRLEGSRVAVNALHPGNVHTELSEATRFLRTLNFFFGWARRTPEQGAKTAIRLASSPDAGGKTGLYYDNDKPARMGKNAYSDEIAERLWQASAALTGLSVGG